MSKVQDMITFAFVSDCGCEVKKAYQTRKAESARSQHRQPQQPQEPQPQHLQQLQPPSGGLILSDSWTATGLAETMHSWAEQRMTATRIQNFKLNIAIHELYGTVYH
ncbi:hypothetical protein ACLKA6_002270 [Drosophila palustris]